ncbi:MAG: isoprenylcysteine carboxylmethyltransferase family protein [Anaerolineae bacterium]|jgi:protein-S-isoprenylcysteine O-methyltransferase Ste14
METNRMDHVDGDRMTLRLVGAVLREVMGVVIVAVTLFVPAGRLNWTMGWALVGLYALWVAATALVLIPSNPQLYLERAARGKGGKDWDVKILSLIGLAVLGKQVVAGLDVRFGWTMPVPLGLQIGAMLVAVGGNALMIWALAVNRFFSKVVRLQEDRGHRTVTRGPYRFVRHPGYVGTIAFDLATPIMLGSLWALIPGTVAASLTLVRTALEDRALQEELDGYRDYAQRVHFRLLPGLW